MRCYGVLFVFVCALSSSAMLVVLVLFVFTCMFQCLSSMLLIPFVL